MDSKHDQLITSILVECEWIFIVLLLLCFSFPAAICLSTLSVLYSTYLSRVFLLDELSCQPMKLKIGFLSCLASISSYQVSTSFS